MKDKKRFDSGLPPEEPSAPAAPKLVEPKLDPALEKFHKMVKMKLPEHVIVNKIITVGKLKRKEAEEKLKEIKVNH